MSVGLFGGSFDPPHAGHRLVSLTALKALQLDRIWWLVSPQNPLKQHAPKEARRALPRVGRLPDIRKFLFPTRKHGSARNMPSTRCGA